MISSIQVLPEAALESACLRGRFARASIGLAFVERILRPLTRERTDDTAAAALREIQFY